MTLCAKQEYTLYYDYAELSLTLYSGPNTVYRIELELSLAFNIGLVRVWVVMTALAA